MNDEMSMKLKEDAMSVEKGLASGARRKTRILRCLMSSTREARKRHNLAHKFYQRSFGEDQKDSFGVDQFIGALSPIAPCSRSTGEDLESISRLFSSIRDASERGIISEDETIVVLEFVTSKFVERRFGGLLSDVFSDTLRHKRTFRRVAGKMRYGR